MALEPRSGAIRPDLGPSPCLSIWLYRPRRACRSAAARDHGMARDTVRETSPGQAEVSTAPASSATGPADESSGHAKHKSGFLGLALALDRRRLRRHRHEPALCAARVTRAFQERGTARRGGDRHRLAPDLGAVFHRHPAKYVLFLMRADNRGEGGTLSPDGAGAAGAAAPFGVRVLPRCRRGGSVLGRCDHHAGDLGALRARGAEARDADLRPLRVRA